MIPLIKNEEFSEYSDYDFNDFPSAFQELMAEGKSPQELAGVLFGVAPGLVDLLWQELAQRDCVHFYLQTLQELTDYENPFGIDELNFMEFPDETAEYFLQELGCPEWIDAQLVDLSHPFDFNAHQIEQQWGRGFAVQNSRAQLVDALSVGNARGDLKLKNDVTATRIEILTANPRWYLDSDVSHLFVFEGIANLEKVAQLQAGRGISYSKLSSDEKLRLISVLISTIEIPEIDGSKISHYILSLLFNHPETPTEGRALISLLSDDHIQLFA